MNYVSIRTQLQTTQKYISPAIRNLVSVFMTVLACENVWK